MTAPQPGPVAWFTGLSGAGKTTLATATKDALERTGHRAAILDGDILRTGLCSDLGFSSSDRAENLRRTAEVAKILRSTGLIVLVSCISPTADSRRFARDVLSPGPFLLVHIEAPLEVCEGRDPKGLYARARAGELPGFTGIDAPYEAPETPDLRIPTDRWDLERCVTLLCDALTADP